MEERIPRLSWLLLPKIELQQHGAAGDEKEKNIAIDWKLGGKERELVRAKMPQTLASY